MAKVVMWIGFTLWTLLTGVSALRDVRIKVPQAVQRGDDATLDCFYDMEDDQLYAVKWYLGTTEFYRYTPRENPTLKQFGNQIGLWVRENASDANRVVLEHVPMGISGRYTCEVSADAPSFFTALKSAYLQVVELPSQDPYITGLKTRYHYGDILRAVCTSERSFPGVNLTWQINGNEAESARVNNSRTRWPDEFYSVHSVLRLKITKQSFFKRRLKIKCVARMYNIYTKSIEKSIEKMRHHHSQTTSTEATELDPQAAETQPERTLIFFSPSHSRAPGLTPPTMLVIFLATLR